MSPSTGAAARSYFLRPYFDQPALAPLLRFIVLFIGASQPLRLGLGGTAARLGFAGWLTW